MRRFFLILSAASLLLLGGCATVESVNPLSSRRAAIPDKRVEGLWHNADSDLYLYVVYGPHGSGSIMRFGKDPAHGLGTITDDFFVTHAAKHDYFNLSHEITRDAGNNHTDNSGHYTFAEYHFSWTGKLIFTDLDGDAFVTAVEKHKLKGKVIYDKKSKNASGVLLKDSSANILSFIESSDPKAVFSTTPEKFIKVGGP